MFMFVIGFITHALIPEQSNTTANENGNKTAEVTKSTNAITNDPLELTLTFQRQFLDGNITVNTQQETIAAMDDFWAEYADWQVIDQSQGEMTFRKQVDDISPDLKQSGYFGLQDSMLTIFEGEPFHQQVIQSFYQIDTETLESRQIEALQQGIKIDSKEKYLQVLEVYRDVSPTKQVQG